MATVKGDGGKLVNDVILYAHNLGSAKTILALSTAGGTVSEAAMIREESIRDDLRGNLHATEELIVYTEGLLKYLKLTAIGSMLLALGGTLVPIVLKLRRNNRKAVVATATTTK
jgi:hypothetical protein